MTDYEEESKAQAALKVNIEGQVGKKTFDKIFTQQIILTIIQYIFSGLLTIGGIIFYCLDKVSSIQLGEIAINGATTFKHVTLNLGTILILAGLYMIIKITLNLNIKIHSK